MRQRMADLQGFEKLITKLSMIRNVALICKLVVRKLIEKLRKSGQNSVPSRSPVGSSEWFRLTSN